MSLWDILTSRKTVPDLVVSLKMPKVKVKSEKKVRTNFSKTSGAYQWAKEMVVYCILAESPKFDLDEIKAINKFVDRESGVYTVEYAHWAPIIKGSRLFKEWMKASGISIKVTRMTS